MLPALALVLLSLLFAACGQTTPGSARATLGASPTGAASTATASPNATAGTVVAAAQTGVGSGSESRYYAGPLPVTLGPNQSLSFGIGITSPTTPGTYTFAFGIVIGGGAPVYVATSLPVLPAPVAHKWTGVACGSAAMQAQMPPPINPPSSYICPES
jgi:hypothetical protein